MRALIQRVRQASVSVDGDTVGKIGPGILTLLGIGKEDNEKDVEWMIQKILKLRIFEDENGKMNLSLQDKKGEHLIVSQFTLYGDCREGNRPSFFAAAAPDLAKSMYEKALAYSHSLGTKTEGGKFQAEMLVELKNDGPVTLYLETPLKL